MTVQLRALAAQLNHVEQTERRRLAQILHDHIQQLLVAVKLQLGMISAGGSASEKNIDQAVKLIDETITATRSLSVELSPPILNDGGLIPALGWLARQMEEKHGLRVELEIDRHREVQNEEIRTIVFAAVRELLFNVVKHSGVSEATVWVGGDDRKTRIEVRDEGEGFDSSAIGQGENTIGGFGLFHVMERIHYLGGSLAVDSRRGKGTTIAVELPADEPELNSAEMEILRKGSGEN
jgi:signal transduction histidine kinase